MSISKIYFSCRFITLCKRKCGIQWPLFYPTLAFMFRQTAVNYFSIASYSLITLRVLYVS